MTSTDPNLVVPVDERRRFERIRLGPDLETVSLAPVAGNTDPVPLLDFSPEGAAVQSSVQPPWADGRVALELRADGNAIPCRARVATMTRRNETAVCGLRLSFDAGQRPALSAAYHKLRFHALQRRGALSERALSELFSESGYTRLKDDIAPSSTWMRANWPSTLTHEAVYVARDGRALGHVSVTRAYPHAWLGHEIATLRHHPEAMRCRRTLYLHFALWPRLLDGEDAHLLGYYNRSRPWHRRMFEDFASRCAPSDCVVVPMDRYTTAAFNRGHTVDSGPTEESVRVIHAGPDHCAVVAKWVEQYWPTLALRAFDIHADSLTSPCMHDAYRASGLTRSRTVLVLCVDDEPVAAALCEWSDSQISLFNVLNMAHIFVSKHAMVSASACNLLIQEVRAFYAQLGASPPLIACPPGTFANTPVHGSTWTETMGCIIWSAEGLRRFERYVAEVITDLPNE